MTATNNNPIGVNWPFKEEFYDFWCFWQNTYSFLYITYVEETEKSYTYISNKSSTLSHVSSPQLIGKIIFLSSVWITPFFMTHVYESDCFMHVYM